MSKKGFYFFTAVMLILSAGLINPAIAKSGKKVATEKMSGGKTASTASKPVSQSPIALNNQANMYYKGKGVKQDYAKALYLYRKAAEKGHMASAITVGYMCENGLGQPKDFAAAMHWYQIAAKQGYASAQNAIGDLYRLGRGVARNDQMAAKWYEKAAAQNFADAQCRLGYMYLRGRGVPADIQKGRQLLEEGVAQNNACSYHYLAFMYMNSMINPLPNTKKALELDVIAARNGDAEAQYNIGKANEIGWVEYASDAEALNWYSHSANQGYPLAMERLSAVYEKGELKQKADPEKAALWKKRAITAWKEWFEPRPASIDQVRFMPVN